MVALNDGVRGKVGVTELFEDARCYAQLAFAVEYFGELVTNEKRTHVGLINKLFVEENFYGLFEAAVYFVEANESLVKLETAHADL